jgi:hypothetical protein
MVLGAKLRLCLDFPNSKVENDLELDFLQK